MYRFGGKPRRMTLGTYPALGLAAARAKHSKAKEQLSRGIDPGAEHVEQRRADRQAKTVQELAAVYLEHHARPKKRSALEDEHALNGDVLPIWGRRKAKDITRHDVIELLDRIVERGAPIQANRVLALVRKMFNFAVKRGILGATPVTLIDPPGKEHQRDRVLSDDEIKDLWAGLDNATMSESVKLALKLQLATAQRMGEVVMARIAEFDFENRMWTIPAERAKNGKSHRVPHSPLAVELVERAIAVAQEEADAYAKQAGIEPEPVEWPFPGRNGPSYVNNGKPIRPGSINDTLEPRCRRWGSKNVTPHDLRRTAGTGMASLGVNRIVLMKVLNHADSTVTAIYDRHGYDAEKRHALETWAAHLESLLSGKKAAANVVPLTAGSRA